MQFFNHILFAVLLLSSTFLNVYGQSILKSNSLNGKWGMNAHLTFPCSINHMDELCKSMAEAGVSMVRLDLYWSPNNMFYQRDDFDKAAYYITKYGMSIELNMPQIPLNLDSITLSKWAAAIGYYAKRYDGTTAIDIGNGERPRNICIQHFEIMNEPEHWQKVGLTVESLFAFIKMSSEAIKKVRKRDNIFVIMPGISRQCDFNKKLLEYHDRDGKGIKDYINVLNFHYYSSNEAKTWDDLFNWIAFFRKYEEFQNMPLLMTEYGHSLWEQTEKEQGRLLPRQALVAAVLGVDIIFYYQFHQFGGNYFFNKRQKEDFFGIIDTSIKNSYGSFWKNDGIYKTAVTDGDGSRKIYITPRRGNQFSLNTLTESICEEIKTNGIAIGGRGFTIDTVILKKGNDNDIVLYTGNFVVPQKGKSKILRLNSNNFTGIEKTDELIVKVKKVANQDDQWDGVHPLNSYYAYKTLTKMCPSGSSVHRIDNNIGVSIVAWETNSVYRYALWSDSKQAHMISVKNGKINSIINQVGERLVNKGNAIRINEDVIYLESSNKLEFLKAL